MLTMSGETYSIVLMQGGRIVQEWEAARLTTCPDGIVVYDVNDKLHLVDLETRTYRDFGGDDRTFDELKMSVVPDLE